MATKATQETATGYQSPSLSVTRAVSPTTLQRAAIATTANTASQETATGYQSPSLLVTGAVSPTAVQRAARATAVQRAAIAARATT